MDEKAPSSFPDGESLDIDELAAKTADDGPAPEESSAPGGGEGPAEDAQTPLAEQIRAGLRWISLPLVPLLVFVAAAVVLAIRGSDDWPAQPGLERIETRAAYPRVAWKIEDGKRLAIIDETAPERPATGVVIFTGNEMRAVTGIPRAGFALQAGPFESKPPRAVLLLDEPVLDVGDNFLLRLGDAAYGGLLKGRKDEIFPGWAYRLFGSETHLLYATVYGRNLLFQDALGRSAPTTPALVTNAAIVALLKADRRKLSRLYFVQRTETLFLGAGSFFPPQQWIKAIVEAVDRTAPHLRAITEVYLVASARSFEFGQVGFKEMPPSDTASVKAALNLPPPSLGARVADNLTKSFSVSLPWPNAAVIFPLRALPVSTALILPGKNGAPGTVNPAAINPIYRSPGRASLLPAVAFFLGFALVLVRLLRREQPDPPDLTKIVQGCLAALALTFVTFRILQFASIEWLFGLDLTGIAELDASGVLGAVSLIAGIGGFLSGRVSYQLARPPRRVAQPADLDAQSRLRAVLYRDVPVHDRDGDRLGFWALVDAVAKFLDNRSTEPPLVLAVNGPWGAGKSSIMRMLATELERTGRFQIAWFNAWKYQKQEQILAAFLKAVATELSREWGVWFSLRLAWIRIREATFSQLCVLSAPFLLLFAAWWAPELLGQLGVVAADAAKDPEEQIAGLATARFVSGAGGAATLLWLARFFLPFRVSYRKLLSMRDMGQHIGFLDQFENEFKLYRKAVDRKKFLIMIDDLDRCHPDAVVEVLKTINLIVTSDAGEGKTFFVLGFDRRFILRSIEHHFKEFAKLGDLVEGRFGPQYLKKIVTIAISVPEPDEAALKSLVERLSKVGTRESEPKGTRAAARAPTGSQLLKKRVEDIIDLARSPISLFAAFVLLAGVLVLWTGGQGTPPADGPERMAAGAENAGAAPSETVLAGGFGGTLVGLPDLSGGTGRTALGVVEAVATALVLLATAMALGGAFNSAVRAHWVRPEPDDSQAFAEAVTRLKGQLPTNPRDLVQVVNRMRMTHLIQARPAVLPKDYKDPFDGEPLDERDSVLLTLLQQRNQRLFDPEFLKILTAGEPGSSADIPIVVGEMSKSKGPFAKLATEFGKLLEESSTQNGSPEIAEVLTDRAKLKRFLAVNRNLLLRDDSAAEAEEKKENSHQGKTGSHPVARRRRRPKYRPLRLQP
jgi:Cdc6-like AAA superfamily ATPase